MVSPEEVTCPECGGTLVLDEHAETDQTWFCPNPGGMAFVEVRRRRAVVAFCNNCEFCVEVRS